MFDLHKDKAGLQRKMSSAFDNPKESKSDLLEVEVEALRRELKDMKNLLLQSLPDKKMTQEKEEEELDTLPKLYKCSNGDILFAIAYFFEDEFKNKKFSLDDRKLVCKPCGSSTTFVDWITGKKVWSVDSTLKITYYDSWCDEYPYIVDTQIVRKY